MPNYEMTKQGVRNLDVPPLDTPQVEDVVEVEEESATKDLFDLIYEDTNELREEILSIWPDAKLEGTYDYIHEHRLEVNLCAREIDWLKWLIRSGWAGASLNFQFSLLNKDKENLIEQAMDAECPGWRKSG